MAEGSSQFGAFAPAFDGFPAYLHLLNLDHGTEPLSLVATCCRASADVDREIALLLNDLDWRPHLVGGIALCFVPFRDERFAHLWRAFDSGSWVSPQLAAIASVCDPGFVELARVRLQALCPIIDSRCNELSAPERHVSRGPGGNSQRSAKAAASLVEMLTLEAQSPDWLAAALSSSSLSGLLAQDVDQAREIARHWVANLRRLLRELDIGLSSG
jgi:hypothetical protein